MSYDFTITIYDPEKIFHYCHHVGFCEVDYASFEKLCQHQTLFCFLLVNRHYKNCPI